MTKSGREIMEIFEAFDLTGTAWSAAQLGAARFEGVIDRRREPVQAAGSWKCQMTSDGQWPAACAADGR